MCEVTLRNVFISQRITESLALAKLSIQITRHLFENRSSRICPPTLEIAGRRFARAARFVPRTAILTLLAEIARRPPMKTFILTLALTSLLTINGWSMDRESQEEQRAEEAIQNGQNGNVAPTFNWTGPYIGIQFGYTRTSSDYS